MGTESRRTDDLLDVARVLLLLQGCILVATTIESVAWGAVFGASGTALLSAASAVTILVARIRLRPDRGWPRRLIFVVEYVTVSVFVIGIVLSLVLAHALPPLLALITQLLLPIAVITLLRRTRRAPRTPLASSHVTALEVAS